MGFMSFTMQNYKNYFNVASDINIFLTIVHFILKDVIVSICPKIDTSLMLARIV